MTEDEAKTKACCGPPVLVSAMFIAANKSPADADAIYRKGCCMGSACMAWHPAFKIEGEKIIAEGYCGLAGQP